MTTRGVPLLANCDSFPTSIRFSRMADGSENHSSSGGTLPWDTYVLPSVADLVFLSLLGVLLFTPLSSKLLSDAGTGWHIRTGQQILSRHSIPRVDSFSSTMAGQPWFAWEWLYDLIVGWLETAWGLNGVVWLTTCIIATVFAWTFRLLICRGVNVLAGTLLLLLALSASTIHFLARPHVVSWLLTLAYFWILDSVEGTQTSRKWLLCLPLLMLVWVNVHGGFVLGFILLAIFWVGAVWEWLGSREDRLADAVRKIAARRRFRDLTLVGLLSALASLINPYGWHLHEHIYGYLTNRFLMNHVDEFQSPNFHDLAPRCFAILILIVVGVVLCRGRMLRLSGAATLLFAIYAGLYASRSIPTSSILLLLVVASLVSRHVRPIPLGERDRQSFLQRMTVMELRQRGHVWCVVGLLGTLLICMSGGRLGSNQLVDAHFSSNRMPVEAVNYIDENHIEGPVLGPDYWGGYLIYRLYPRLKVVVDDRHDLYGEQFLSSYLKFIHAEPGWQEFVQAHPASGILVPRNAALATVLEAAHDWRPVFADSQAILFKRTFVAERK